MEIVGLAMFFFSSEPLHVQSWDTILLLILLQLAHSFLVLRSQLDPDDQDFLRQG